MGQCSSYSIMGVNIKLINHKYCTDDGVYISDMEVWKCMCEHNENSIKVCMQVKELVDLSNRYCTLGNYHTRFSLVLFML